MSSTTSRRLGRYELVSYLGSGGMSDVYVALHTGLRKRVALKLLRPSLRCDEHAVQRFLREGECAARVRHPNVVDVSDVGMEGGVPYLVMELLEGETLAQRLTHGALDLESAVDLLLPILDAVAAVHATGVLHRDIKPANILLARAADGSLLPKLVDFGIALMPEFAHEDDDRALGPLGTPHYMSPEQARGESMDERSDQYALASVLFEMLTAREPYVGKTVETVLNEVARGRFPRLRALLPAMPLALEEVLLRAASRHPGQRFASVNDFAYALVPFASARTRKLFVSRDERAGVYSAQLLPGSFRMQEGLDPGRAAQALAGSVAPHRRGPRLNQRVARALSGAALLGAGLIAGFGVTQGVAEAERAMPPAQVVEADATSGLLAALAPSPRRTRVRLQPEHAVAHLDGMELGRGAVVLPELATGMHELRVSAPGHVSRVVLFRDALVETTIALDRRLR